MQSGAFHSANVDENVLATIIWLNEAKTLLAVEPLNNTCRHNLSFIRETKNNAVQAKYDRLAALGTYWALKSPSKTCLQRPLLQNCDRPTRTHLDRGTRLVPRQRDE